MSSELDLLEIKIDFKFDPVDVVFFVTFLLELYHPVVLVMVFNTQQKLLQSKHQRMSHLILK